MSEVQQIRQMLALALSRRNWNGDRDRAVVAMKEVIARTGGDAGSHGILGRIYRNR